MDGKLTLNPVELKALRRQNGLSQEAVAYECQCRGIPLSIASIKRSEMGKKVLYRTAKAYADFYQVTVNDLLLQPDQQ